MLCRSLAFDVMCAFGAVILLPVPCYYGTSIASNFSGIHQKIYFFIGVYTAIGKGMAYFYQFIFRGTQVVPPGHVFKTLTFSFLPLPAYLGVYVLIINCIALLIFVSQLLETIYNNLLKIICRAPLLLTFRIKRNNNSYLLPQILFSIRYILSTQICYVLEVE